MTDLIRDDSRSPRTRRRSRRTVPSSVHETLQGPGTSVDNATSDRMARLLGHDFSQVRIHSGRSATRSARDIGTRAYASAHHVVVDDTSMPTGTAERDVVIAHELVHTLQSTGSVLRPDRLSDPESPAERDASTRGRAADTAGRAATMHHPPSAVRARAGVIHRDPVDVRPPSHPLDSTPGDVGLTLKLTEDGKLEVTGHGPKLGSIGKPSIGLTRLPNGQYRLSVGADDTVLGIDEIPAKLRGIVKSVESGGKPGHETLYVPTCEQLQKPGGRGWHTFQEYKIATLLRPGAEPISEGFYRSLLALCKELGEKKRREEPAPEPRAPHEDVPPAAPEGEAYA